MTTAVPEISVVVPFCNIEQCVGYCVDSLLLQTYDDYEIVLVDDGSTDGTGALLDACAGDARVRVFHKENGGLSDARNFGVAQSRGRYITFVDGDDFVSPHYLDALAKGAEGMDDVFVMGSSKGVKLADAVNGDVEWERPAQGAPLTRREVCERILYKRIGTVAWARLARREVYEQTPFPTGRVFEEMLTVASFVGSCSRYILIDEPVYAYVVRPGSIVWERSVAVSKARAHLEAADACARGLLGLDPGLNDAAVYFRSYLSCRTHSMLLRAPDCPERVQMERDIRRYVRRSLPTTLLAPPSQERPAACACCSTRRRRASTTGCMRGTRSRRRASRCLGDLPRREAGPAMTRGKATALPVRGLPSWSHASGLVGTEAGQ